MSLDSLCRWQVQVSVYCAWRIPAHLRCTQCSILLHLMDICFLTCICLWQISQIQTFCLKLSDLDWSRHHPLFREQPAPSIQRVRMPKNGKNRAPIAGGGEVRHNLHSSLKPLCYSSTAVCRLCRLEPITERRDMGLYEVPLSVSLLGNGIGTMLANFHV